MNIVNKDSKNTFTRMCIGEAIIKLLKDTDFDKIRITSDVDFILFLLTVLIILCLNILRILRITLSTDYTVTLADCLIHF